MTSDNDKKAAEVIQQILTSPDVERSLKRMMKEFAIYGQITHDRIKQIALEEFSKEQEK